MFKVMEGVFKVMGGGRRASVMFNVMGGGEGRQP